MMGAIFGWKKDENTEILPINSRKWRSSPGFFGRVVEVSMVNGYFIASSFPWFPLHTERWFNFLRKTTKTTCTTSMIVLAPVRGQSFKVLEGQQSFASLSHGQKGQEPPRKFERRQGKKIPEDAGKHDVMIYCEA